MCPAESLNIEIIKKKYRIYQRNLRYSFLFIILFMGIFLTIMTYLMYNSEDSEYTPLFFTVTLCVFLSIYPLFIKFPNQREVIEEWQAILGDANKKWTIVVICLSMLAVGLLISTILSGSIVFIALLILIIALLLMGIKAHDSFTTSDRNLTYSRFFFKNLKEIVEILKTAKEQISPDSFIVRFSNDEYRLLLSSTSKESNYISLISFIDECTQVDVVTDAKEELNRRLRDTLDAVLEGRPLPEAAASAATGDGGADGAAPTTAAEAAPEGHAAEEAPEG